MSLLEDMIDTLVMTAQEEDFERGNSSKGGRADDSEMMTAVTSRPRRRIDVVRGLVENVPNLLKLPTVIATTRRVCEKRTIK